MAAEVLRGNLWVLDTEDRTLTTTVGPAGSPNIDVRILTEAAATAGRAVQREDWWGVCVTAGPESLGTLLLHTEHKLNEWDQRTFERAALVTALLLLLRRSVAETETRIKGELLDDILDGSPRDIDNLR